MEIKKAKTLGSIAGVSFTIGIITLLRICDLEIFSRTTNLLGIISPDYHNVISVAIKLILLYIGIELFSRAYRAGFTLGYKIDGLILAACVLFSVYYGGFIYALAPLGIYIGVLLDVIASRDKAASSANAQTSTCHEQDNK